MGAKTKVKKAPKSHGWEQHGKGGKPPFPGAAPPIHTVNGGKFVAKKKARG